MQRDWCKQIAWGENGSHAILGHRQVQKPSPSGRHRAVVCWFSRWFVRSSSSSSSLLAPTTWKGSVSLMLAPCDARWIRSRLPSAPASPRTCGSRLWPSCGACASRILRLGKDQGPRGPRVSALFCDLILLCSQGKWLVCYLYILATETSTHAFAESGLLPWVWPWTC